MHRVRTLARTLTKIHSPQKKNYYRHSKIYDVSPINRMEVVKYISVTNKQYKIFHMQMPFATKHEFCCNVIENKQLLEKDRSTQSSTVLSNFRYCPQEKVKLQDFHYFRLASPDWLVVAKKSSVGLALLKQSVARIIVPPR